MNRNSTIRQESGLKKLAVAVRVLLIGTLFGTCSMIERAEAQVPQCDPSKVMTAAACANCHAPAVQVWKNTPHFKTFNELGRRPEAKAIYKRMGLKSAKRSDVCTKCHYTMRETNGRLKAVAGVSCESCHGASKDWITIHNDYGGPTATKQSETEQHASQRLQQATDGGMRNTRNLYLIASSCLNCHSVPNEKLVNVGGHNAGSLDFELVAWSQGQVRHNFLREGGQVNARSKPNRLRIMYVVGLVAELEYSTRATAEATETSKFGKTVANRAAAAALKLYKLQQKINNPAVQKALEAFASAELRTNNSEQLLPIADQIREAGIQFSRNYDGSTLAAVDAVLPDPSTYK